MFSILRFFLKMSICVKCIFYFIWNTILRNIPFVYLAFISISIIILQLLIDHVRRKKKQSSEPRSFSSCETRLSIKFERHASTLKRISQQLSEDRAAIKESVLKDYFDFQKHAFEELEFLQPSVPFDLLMLQEYPAQNTEVEDFVGTLATVESDYLMLKNQLHAFPSVQNANTQQEDCDSGKITNILTEIKEEFTKFILENRSKEKETFQTISKFLLQCQTDIRKEVVLFNTVADCRETFNAENFKMNLQVTAERMEKMKNNLISAQTCCNRQCSEMEKLQQILVNFNQKFTHFVDMFNKLWKQNVKTNSSFRRRLEEAYIACTSVTEKIDINASLLIMQSKIFAHILADVKDVLRKNKPNIDCLPLSITETLEDNSLELTNNTDTLWINNVDVLKEKLENIIHISEKVTEKLESLNCTSNKFENFHNLMKSMTRSYNTLLRYFLSTLEKSQKFHRPPKVKLRQNERPDKNGRVICDDGKKKMVKSNGNSAGDVKVWDEVRSELDVKLQNADIDNIVFILKDIMKSVRKLLDEGQVVPGDIYETVQSRDCQQWGDFPSESLLTDISSEFIAYSSDESTCDLSEVTLEG